jgi:hypothetical protein
VSGSVYPPPSSGGQGYGVADPVAAFEQLDPADDGFLEKQAVIFQGADPQVFRSPSVQNKIRQANAAHAEAQTYFKEDPSLVDFYIEQRNKNIAPQVAIGELRKRAQDSALKGAALKSGLLLDEYEALRDPASGTVDKFKLQDFANRREREIATRKAAERDMPKDVTAEAYNRLLNDKDAAAAAAALQTPEGKVAAFKKKYGDKKNPTTEAEWDEAYALVQKDVDAAKSKFENARRAYASQYKLPADLSGEPVTAAQSAAPAPDVGTPAVTPALPAATTPPIEQAPAGTGPAPAPVAPAVPTAETPASTAPAPMVEGEYGTLNSMESDAEARARDERLKRVKTAVSEVQKLREKEVNSLGEKLSAIGDKNFIQRAMQSIVQGELVSPSVFGFDKEKDLWKGDTRKLPEELIAQKLGVDIDAPVVTKDASGKETKLSRVGPKTEEVWERDVKGGVGNTLLNVADSFNIRDLPRGDVTWRDLIRDYAAKATGRGPAGPAPIKSSVPNVTIGQIRQVP